MTVAIKCQVLMEKEQNMANVPRQTELWLQSNLDLVDEFSRAKMRTTRSMCELASFHFNQFHSNLIKVVTFIDAEWMNYEAYEL